MKTSGGQVTGAANRRLDLPSLREGYQQHGWSVRQVMETLLRRLDDEAERHPNVWITRTDAAAVLARAAELDELRNAPQALARLPLWGVPFAVKDNIEVAGMPTTAACPAYAYMPQASAPCVERLLAAGALCLGKTNLDQFATGLVGTRSPYGVVRNPFHHDYVAGGSSSGSAVAVAAGWVSFALGTDTAGSGRVPAGFNNIVGLKPSRGLVSTQGVVPACQSLDCVNVFALTCDDAATVFNVMSGLVASDPWSRHEADLIKLYPAATVSDFRMGVVSDNLLREHCDEPTLTAYRTAVDHLQYLGGQVVSDVDFAPFAEAGTLLYDGPWLAERYASFGAFMEQHPEACLPVLRDIMAKAHHFSADDVFHGQYRLAQLQQQADAQWHKMDVLLLPTTPTIYQIAQIQASPLELNRKLGVFTLFANLLDCCGVSVPAGFRPDGLPVGVSLYGPALHDDVVGKIARALHRRTSTTLGATGQAWNEPLPKHLSGPKGHGVEMTPQQTGVVRLAVVGAHLRGQPLNHELTRLQATFVRQTTTTAEYRLYALAGGAIPKPGLVRVTADGAAIEVEVWDVPTEQFGRLMAGVPAPLAIGTLTLDNGEVVKGFLCEPCALPAARDITRFRGWRGYLRAALATD